MDKDKQIKELEAELEKTRSMVVKLAEQVYHLKEVLFCCKAVAVFSFDGTIVALVNREIKDFQIPEERFRELVLSVGKLPSRQIDNDTHG